MFLSIYKALQQCGCTYTKQAVFHRRSGKYLANHVLRTENAGSEFQCVIYCLNFMPCASINYKTAGIDKGLCEMNSEVIDDSTNIGTDNLEYNYLSGVGKTIHPGAGNVSNE